MPEYESGALPPSFQTSLGIFYLLVVLLNVGFAAYQSYAAKNKRVALVGLVWALVFLLHGGAYLTHLGWQLPESFRAFTTSLMGAWGGQAGPILYSTLSVVGFVLFLRYRK